MTGSNSTPPNETAADGLEPESESLHEGGLPEAIDEPFDPLQIKISRRTVPIELVMRRIGYGEIELAPDFQRRARIWDIGRKSRLIESILLRIPLPVFYVAADLSENWRVVDGLQRLTTIYDFTNPSSSYSFRLHGLEYLGAYEGAGFIELPRSIKRRIEETELNINVIESGTPDEVTFNVFKRLNTGGISLNGQEIRHALNPGPARDFLLMLSQADEFRRATNWSVRDDRMGARELVLRFCAFYIVPPENYYGSDLDGFLNEAMRTLNLMTSQEREDIHRSFLIAMQRAYSIFGDDAFRKRTDPTAYKTPINRALFEAWSVPLARLDQLSADKLTERRQEVKERFAFELLYTTAFLSSISVSTGSRQRVLERFHTIGNIMRETINA
jgi:Protein of unknown function DUF262